MQDATALGLGARCDPFGGRVAVNSCTRGRRVATIFKLEAVRRLCTRLDGVRRGRLLGATLHVFSRYSSVSTSI